MRSLLAYSKENFRIFSLGLLEKGFMLEYIVNIRNECLIFLHSWEMNLGEAVTYLPRTALRFTGFVTCLTQVHFPWTQKKRHSFLKYVLLHHSPTYTCTNVYIGIRSTCMYKSHFHRIAFIRAQVAQTVEHSATNLKDVGSSLTVSKNFSFCILSLSTCSSWQVGWSRTNEFKNDINPR